MASACMGDIAILEVALRNRMDRQLSLLALEQNGTEDWYMAGLQFDDRTQYQIREAWNHLTPHQRKNHTHGHLIASWTFGFWRNLLEDGGTIHTKWPDQRRADYENDLWRKGLDKTFSNGRQYARAVEERWTRKYALDIVKQCMPCVIGSLTMSRLSTAYLCRVRIDGLHWRMRRRRASLWR